jgi:hypothetical protein
MPIKSFAHYWAGTLVFPFNASAHHDPDRIGARGNRKEVDGMVSIKTPQTAQIPSAFGMPACAHAQWTSNGATTVVPTGVATSVVRDRQAVVGADLGLAQGYFPGTPAWRPPTC